MHPDARRTEIQASYAVPATHVQNLSTHLEVAVAHLTPAFADQPQPVAAVQHARKHLTLKTLKEVTVQCSAVHIMSAQRVQHSDDIQHSTGLWGQSKVQHRPGISTDSSVRGRQKRSHYSLNCYQSVYTANTLLCWSPCCCCAAAVIALSIAAALAVYQQPCADNGQTTPPPSPRALITCMSMAAGSTVPPLLALLLLLFGADVSTELPAVAAIDAGLLPLLALLGVIPIRALR